MVPGSRPAGPSGIDPFALDEAFVARSLSTLLVVGSVATLWLVQTMEAGLTGGFALGVLLSTAVLAMSRFAVQTAIHPGQRDPGIGECLALGALWILKLVLMAGIVWVMLRRAGFWPGAIAAGLGLGPLVVALKTLGRIRMAERDGAAVAPKGAP